MIVLGIDSSTDRLGVGIADAGRIIFEDMLDSVQEHASQIIGMIDSVLRQAKLGRNDIEGIAIADGPGSFTGLRIGMAAAKGMALAMNIPIVGVSTFEVIARRLRSEYDRFYLTALVRKGELYLCRVDRETEIRENIGLINQEALPAKIGSMPIAVVGRKPEGWDGLAENIIPDEKTFISGGELALLGAELISAGKVSDLAMLEPLYIAPSQAERKFGRK
jgi:tRNA threonylcarbamoyladenosine biosynthesis protein TsaB